MTKKEKLERAIELNRWLLKITFDELYNECDEKKIKIQEQDIQALKEAIKVLEVLCDIRDNLKEPREEEK